MRIICKAKPLDSEGVLLSSYTDTYRVTMQHKLEYLGVEYGIIFMLSDDLNTLSSIARRREPIKTLIFKLSAIPKFLDKDSFYGSIEKYFDRINTRGYIEVDFRSFDGTGGKAITKDFAVADVPYGEIYDMNTVKKIIDVMNSEEK